MPDVVIIIEVATIPPHGRSVGWLKCHQAGRFVDAETVVQDPGDTVGAFRAVVADRVTQLLDRAQ